MSGASLRARRKTGRFWRISPRSVAMHAGIWNGSRPVHVALQAKFTDVVTYKMYTVKYQVNYSLSLFVS